MYPTRHRYSRSLYLPQPTTFLPLILSLPRLYSHLSSCLYLIHLLTSHSVPTSPLFPPLILSYLTHLPTSHPLPTSPLFPPFILSLSHPPSHLSSFTHLTHLPTSYPIVTSIPVPTSPTFPTPHPFPTSPTSIPFPTHPPTSPTFPPPPLIFLSRHAYSISVT
ncbi:hypothetical protein Pcinc_038520 [Petrolisthes cinctipes]|uniref:Uncharacterized protein n=1 Tax=Petrolisthes cinctipes TaxID=88211 RepID=A0AAE1EMY1_PETCI|nr:hypothetical protein Pcinc_038520 [Petrolisthes cinctipes]